MNALLAVPPIRFVMDLVDSRWRPLWAALWIGVIIYLLSRAMNQLALARARLRIVSEPMGGLALAMQHPGDSPRPDGPDGTPLGRSASRDPAGSPTAPEKPAARESGGIPVHIVIAALVVGAIAVVNVALFMRRPPNDSAGSPAASATASADSAAQANAPIDMRMRSSRMDDSDNCVTTFEVTHGPGTTARLVAFAMDSSGGIIARDSMQITSAVTGMFVDFRFRHVDCDEIDDWQIQATTPTLRSQ